MEDNDSPSASDLLSRAFRDRNIAFDDQEIASALDAGSIDGRNNQRWVLNHLGGETLLTEEELALWVEERIRRHISPAGY
jgi:hypothetical protein